MSPGSAILAVVLTLCLSMQQALATPACAAGAHQSCPHECPMPHRSAGAATIADKPCSTSCCNLSSAKIVEAATVPPTTFVTLTVSSHSLPRSEQGQINTTHRLVLPPKSCQQAVLCTFLV